MRFALHILVFSLVGTLLQAQDFPSEVFHRGEALLVDGFLKRGMVKYDLDSDVILFQDSTIKGMETISAVNLKAFRLLPEEELPLRLFYVLPFQNETGYKRPKIFEVLYENQYSLLGREFIATRPNNPNAQFAGQARFDPFNRPFNQNNITHFSYLDYKLFLVNPFGEVVELTRIKREVIAAFVNYQEEVKSYIKKERLRVDKFKDILQLVKYYNELVEQ